MSHLPLQNYNLLVPPIGYIPGLYRGDHGFGNKLQGNTDQLQKLCALYKDESKK